MEIIKDNKPRNLLDECQKSFDSLIKTQPKSPFYIPPELYNCIHWLIEYLKQREWEKVNPEKSTNLFDYIKEWIYNQKVILFDNINHLSEQSITQRKIMLENIEAFILFHIIKINEKHTQISKRDNIKLEDLKDFFIETRKVVQSLPIGNDCISERCFLLDKFEHWIQNYIKNEEKQQSESHFIKGEKDEECLVEANLINILEIYIENKKNQVVRKPSTVTYYSDFLRELEDIQDFIKNNKKCSTEYVNNLREDNRKYYHIIQYIKQLLKEKTQTPNDSFDKILNFIQKEETNENI